MDKWGMEQQSQETHQLPFLKCQMQFPSQQGVPIPVQYFQMGLSNAGGQILIASLEI